MSAGRARRQRAAARLAFPNDGRHRAPHQPTRKLLRQRGKSVHDNAAASNRSVIFDMSEFDTIEERQVRPHDKVGIKARRRDAHGNLTSLEQQPHIPAVRAYHVDLAAGDSGSETVASPDGAATAGPAIRSLS